MKCSHYFYVLLLMLSCSINTRCLAHTNKTFLHPRNNINAFEVAAEAAVIEAYNVANYVQFRERFLFDFADQARFAKTHGFQGCINKEICGSNGFYGQTYSPEGLCDKCERKQYPERYVETGTEILEEDIPEDAIYDE